MTLTPDPTGGIQWESVGHDRVTLTLSGNTGDWRYKYTKPDGGSCSSQQSSSTTEVTVTGLTGGTVYVFAVYSDSTCTAANAVATAAAFITPWPLTTPLRALLASSLSAGTRATATTRNG